MTLIHTIAINGLDYCIVEQDTELSDLSSGVVGLRVVKVLDSRLGTVDPDNLYDAVVLRRYDAGGLLIGELRYLDATILRNERIQAGHVLVMRYRQTQLVGNIQK